MTPIIDLEKWLKDNGIQYTAKRNLKNGQIEFKFEKGDLTKLKAKYDALVLKMQWTPEQRILMAFILCEFKGLALQESMLSKDSNLRLKDEQKAALSPLFIKTADDIENAAEDEDEDQYEDEDEDEEEEDQEAIEKFNRYLALINDVTPDDMLVFIEQYLVNVQAQVKLLDKQYISEDLKAQMTDGLKNNYYYLLRIIKAKIKNLKSANDKINKKIISRNDDENDSGNNDYLDSASTYTSNHNQSTSGISSGNNTATTNSSSSVPVITIDKKIELDPKVIDITMTEKEVPGYGKYTAWDKLRNLAAYVIDGFWSWFSWSNYYLIHHFSDNAADKKAYNPLKQAVKDSYHAYKLAVEELSNAIPAFNQAADRFLAEPEILEKFAEVERKKTAVLSDIVISKLDLTEFWNADLFIFYNDIEVGLNEHQNTINAQRDALQKESTLIRGYYAQLTENIDSVLDRSVIAARATLLVSLVKSGFIYAELVQAVNNKTEIGKANFMKIMEVAAQQIVEQTLATNISQYHDNEGLWVSSLLEFLMKINSDQRVNPLTKIGQLNDRVLSKCTAVGRYEAAIKIRHDNMAKGLSPDPNAALWAMELVVVEKHAPVDTHTSYGLLDTLYNRHDWWPHFNGIYTDLKNLLEGKSEVALVQLLEKINDFYITAGYRNVTLDSQLVVYQSLQRTFDILKEDYPKTAPGLDQQMRQIIEAKIQDLKGGFMHNLGKLSDSLVGMFKGTVWGVGSPESDNNSVRSYNSSFSSSSSSSTTVYKQQ
jgi:hypothetical protein